jgi:hypothetical protein
MMTLGVSVVSHAGVEPCGTRLLLLLAIGRYWVAESRVSTSFPQRIVLRHV